MGAGKRRYAIVWGGALLAVVLATAIWLKGWTDDRGGERSTEAEPSASPELSAWLADWNWKVGLEDLDKAADGLDSLQVFAAYFDESDGLTFTEDFSEGLPAIRERLEQDGEVRMDLTLVNDILREDGTESQKDPDLLSRLLADSTSRTRHIAEIAAAVEKYGFDGVELDYEQVKDGDWDGMVVLIAELQAKLNELGKSLRVVLEPRAPLEKLELPEGPTYVMMAYNLYGGHSGPGPKADDVFIRELAERMEKRVPGIRYIAISTGGFDWIGEGDADGITERMAADLAKNHSSEPVRDSSSGSLRFSYEDAEGQKHEVWYADGQTLKHWAAIVREAGIPGIAIWRLGELGDDSLERIRTGFGSTSLSN